MPEDVEKKFPSGFLWGASTSAHQVEGGNHNNWTVWELENAAQLAKNAKERVGFMPLWNEIKEKAQNPENYVSGKGVDHYNLYKEDFSILKSLNMNALRFGIEWSRLEPEEGQWNQEAIAHYHEYINELDKQGIEPILNIWHMTLPVWFAEKGGFKRRANLKYFDRYVQKLSQEYGNKLRYVITLNEPNVYATFCYFVPDPTAGTTWPPSERNVFTLLRVYWNLVTAHKNAYKIIKKAHHNTQVGLAIQLGNIQAKRPHNIFDELSTKIMRYGWNWWFLRRVRKYQDFVGFNYYFTDYYTGLFKRENPHVPLNNLGWYMEPEGLYPILLRVWSRYKKPIIITENGVADMHDEYRRWWIEETIVALQRAQSEGVELKGYFHWSLLDNFEWAVGWWPKFGLVSVDRQHGMKRQVRPSAKWFAEVIKKLQ
jgi:beta-glucosidase